MKAVLLVKNTASHQMLWAGAFGTGLERHGWEVDIRETYRPCDMLVMWGVRREQDIFQAKVDGAEVCILEAGYLEDRLSFASVSFGGELNGLARFSDFQIDDERVAKHGFDRTMKPWKTRPQKNVLLLGQVDGDMSLKGLNQRALLTDSGNDAKSLGYHVMFRPHPLGNTYCPGFTARIDTLYEALDWADIAVTVNSNSGVDAVLAGVPTVALDARSMVWDVSTRSVRTARPFERFGWLNRLSYRQWTVDEMVSGQCWDHAKHATQV